MKLTNAVIRAARESDAEQLGAVHCQAWLETYPGLLPDSFLATRSPAKSTAMFRASRCRDTAVAEAGGKIFGFCGWSPFRDSAPDAGMGEIQGIYLLNGYKRMGFGQKLMEYALEQLRSHGYEKAGLWVLAGNTPAIRFYEKQGFRYSGIRKEANLGMQVSELLYTKEIGR